MKIIVVSDSHGSSTSLEKVMALNSNADIVVHCGDSRGEMEDIKMKYPDIAYYEVRGNCDIASTLPLTRSFTVDGIKFMATHGHAYGVKYGVEDLLSAAKDEGASVVFYGHTHFAKDEVIDGIRLLCPGACGGWGASFAVVETKNGQVLSNIAYVRKLK